MARDDNGVHHPFDSKAALLSVTRSNVLKILCQQDGQPWTEATFHLGELSDSDDAISHAAFGQNDEPGKTDIFAYTVLDTLRDFANHANCRIIDNGDIRHVALPTDLQSPCYLAGWCN